MSSSKNISIIVAVAENMAIGINNKLLCYLPDDLKMFKKRTEGNTVIMGRNTWLSLPLKPLPQRKNIVLTDRADEVFEGAVMAYSIDQAEEEMHPYLENFIMGGAMVYQQFMPYANVLYVTRIHGQFIADTYFPEISDADWVLISSTPHEADEKHPYAFSFEVYNRRFRS
jgi:dihydrofolate reductase